MKLKKKTGLVYLATYALKIAAEIAAQNNGGDIQAKYGRSLSVEAFLDYMENEGIKSQNVAQEVTDFLTAGEMFGFEIARINSEKRKKTDEESLEEMRKLFS